MRKRHISGVSPSTCISLLQKLIKRRYVRSAIIACFFFKESASNAWFTLDMQTILFESAIVRADTRLVVRELCLSQNCSNVGIRAVTRNIFPENRGARDCTEPRLNSSHVDFAVELPPRELQFRLHRRSAGRVPCCASRRYLPRCEFPRVLFSVFQPRPVEHPSMLSTALRRGIPPPPGRMKTCTE